MVSPIKTHLVKMMRQNTKRTCLLSSLDMQFRQQYSLMDFASMRRPSWCLQRIAMLHGGSSGGSKKGSRKFDGMPSKSVFTTSKKKKMKKTRDFKSTFQIKCSLYLSPLLLIEYIGTQFQSQYEVLVCKNFVHTKQ